MATLTDYLGRAYGAQVLSKEPLATVVADFKAAVAGDAALLAEAQARLASYTDDITGRDFQSKVAKQFLEAGLS